MPIIATEAQAKSIGGSSASVTTNLMVTRVRAVALGCSIRNSYSDKQLVCLRDLYRVWCNEQCTGNHQQACNVVGCVGDCSSNCSCQSSNCTCNATCDCTGGHWSSSYCSCNTTCDCTGGHCDCNNTCTCYTTCNNAIVTTTCSSKCTCYWYINHRETCASETCQGNVCSSTYGSVSCDSDYDTCAQNSAYPCGSNQCWSYCNYDYSGCGDCASQSCGWNYCLCDVDVTCSGKTLSCTCEFQCSCVSGNKVTSITACSCNAVCNGNCSNCKPNACVGDCSGNHQYACSVVGCIEDGKGSTYKCTCHTTCDCTGGHWSSSYCSCDTTCACYTVCTDCPANG